MEERERSTWNALIWPSVRLSLAILKLFPTTTIWNLFFSYTFKNKNRFIKTKDQKNGFQKHGICEICCPDRNSKYYGQTKCRTEKRFSERLNCIEKNESNKSAVAAHVLNDIHSPLNISNVRPLKCVCDNQKLDAYESIYI